MNYICQCCGITFNHNCRVRPRKYCSRACYDRGRVRELQARLMKRLDRTGSCWLWMGALNSDGYGTINVNGSSKLTHRVAYTLFCGSIPDGKEVCHTCDTPACCNPNHLFLGETLDNMQDMAMKARSCFGERHPKAKLTEEQVLEARRLHSAGLQTASSLGRMFGVAEQTISALLKRRTWKRI